MELQKIHYKNTYLINVNGGQKTPAPNKGLAKKGQRC